MVEVAEWYNHHSIPIDFLQLFIVVVVVVVIAVVFKRNEGDRVPQSPNNPPSTPHHKALKVFQFLGAVSRCSLLRVFHMTLLYFIS